MFQFSLLKVSVLRRQENVSILTHIFYSVIDDLSREASLTEGTDVHNNNYNHVCISVTMYFLIV